MGLLTQLRSEHSQVGDLNLVVDRLVNKYHEQKVTLSPVVADLNTEVLPKSNDDKLMSHESFESLVDISEDVCSNFSEPILNDEQFKSLDVVGNDV